MGIAENLDSLRREIPSSVKIIAVSKTKPVSDIMQAYQWGQRDFGENKAQEMAEKHLILSNDIAWHMIGHLQTNKVRLIVPFVHLIHAVDSFKLLSVINSEAKNAGRVINCLLQIHIAKEETKFGLTPEEASGIIESAEYRMLENVSVRGLMGMATFTPDSEVVKNEFLYLAGCFSALRKRYFSNEEKFNELSMGMSGDYRVALDAGSTMVRIGSSIFGTRAYLPAK